MVCQFSETVALIWNSFKMKDTVALSGENCPSLYGRCLSDPAVGEHPLPNLLADAFCSMNSGQRRGLPPREGMKAMTARNSRAHSGSPVSRKPRTGRGFGPLHVDGVLALEWSGCLVSPCSLMIAYTWRGEYLYGYRLLPLVREHTGRKGVFI